MTTSQSTIDYLLDQLSGLPNVRSREMFGEYALYCDEKVVCAQAQDAQDEEEAEPLTAHALTS